MPAQSTPWANVAALLNCLQYTRVLAQGLPNLDLSAQQTDVQTYSAHNGIRTYDPSCRVAQDRMRLRSRGLYMYDHYNFPCILWTLNLNSI